MNRFIALIFVILFGWLTYRFWQKRNDRKRKTKNVLLSILFAVLTLGSFGNVMSGDTTQEAQPKQDNVSQHASSTKEHKKVDSKKATAPKKVTQSRSKTNTEPTKAIIDTDHKVVLAKLIKYTDSQSAGPTKNYYWVNGKSKLTGFKNLKAGDYHFASDSQGRAATAKAVLTYSEYQASKGSRQGAPLDPPAWPSANPKVAISYILTGRTYHGYLYNRSHSIGDSLLGEKSYTSENNFTTGTRPQNVGADQNGGMRYAEETAENYWDTHTNTSNTINYETTPVYKDDETIPRGSIINLKSSDGSLNTEIVVINSVEGIDINYSDGSNNAKPLVTTQKKAPQSHAHDTNQTDTSVKSDTDSSDNTSSNDTSNTDSNEDGYTTSGSWSVAEPGMVFVSDTQKYYSRVKNPGNYEYISEDAALSNGAQQAPRGNEYARP
ncbi:DNA/RNA non-specific endonuclease [Lentilactobacillus kribbianus]|uniref:DNA/RNA non-specific endonuclease n=1 Tax=Lentilactobacillus kribbianus TaxID=2729622 RepID=UPI001FEBB71E|nr:DNA/RNA non-specific endonuclease [Lentilactobacillus kribbianus]